MDFNPLCLINILLAITALLLYIVGSYRLYRNQPGFTLILGLAIAIDITTAVLASFKITPTAEIAGTVRIPWHSVLFIAHVVSSMIGFVGFILLFIYLLARNPKYYSTRLRVWQYKYLLPLWVFGEGIALVNALTKVFWGIRIYEYF